MTDQDQLYAEAAATYAAALERLARAYEADADRSRDLLQDIHVALWQSLLRFEGRCSLRTWVYRVAHNVATSQVIGRRASTPTLVGLEEIDEAAPAGDADRAIDAHRALERLQALVRRLKPLDRQVMVQYLEGMDAASILHRHGSARGMPADLGLTSSLQFHRRELERQRDLLRGVWKWYLAPLMPGLILGYLGGILARPEHARRAVLGLAGTLVLYWLIAGANRHAANRLQARIDALERNE